MSQTSNRSSPRWTTIIVIVLFVLTSLVFVIAFVSTTQSEIAAVSEPTLELSADTYVDEVTRLLQDADPQNGAHLVEQHACIACHRLATQANIAPPFEGIAERTATRRPPLTAAAYLYEAIVDPAVYIVDGYQTVMPQNYRNLLSERDLGDIIAYLLTPDAN